MCFGSKKDSSNERPPQPAQIPHSASTSAPPASASASASGKMNQDFAPPAGPPPSKRPSRPEDYAAPSGPPPSHSQKGHDFAPPSGPPPSQAANDFAPPPGPPPARRHDDYAPPSGPPPRQNYAPPSGPPPSKGHGGYDDFAPPPGPPPPAQLGKKHAWEEAVPDTSELPPPPPFFGAHDFSFANNATEEEAEAGEAFCRSNPMLEPEALDPTNAQAQQQGNYRLLWMNENVTIAPVALGVWKGFSKVGTPDTSIISWPPMYSVSAHGPWATGRTKVIYYEVNFLKDSRQEISMALGFAVPPYPGFRLPGWHRGSLAVHGDDGHKYINDRWGGKDFTQPFKRGETVGIGMKFVPLKNDGVSVKIFMTRDGIHQRGWEWDLYEETDMEQDGAVKGLDGFRDLCAAVGVFEKVHFEMVFAPWRWKWQGLEEYSKQL
ncbi:Dual specificity protein kinase splA [Apiospora kogelbergensis]|uniref:Dual specificity protein kinase splA n=1 Tax=Apiospora kogelbergensis TaxID=1337665 RepID=A0AAW0QDD9_9PEZI